MMKMFSRKAIAAAAVAVLGMALALTGCPAVADNRDGEGPGNHFGNTAVNPNQPAGPVTIIVTGIPEVFWGSTTHGAQASVWLDATGLPTVQAWETVRHGSVMFTMPNVRFPAEYTISLTVAGIWAGTIPAAGIQIAVGENPPVPFDTFN